MVQEQRFVPLLDLQDWFTSNEGYNPSIHRVLDPIIRELYCVAAWSPINTIKPDNLENLLQLTSDWAFVEENKDTFDALRAFFPRDVVNIIWQFTNVPLGNNEKRRTQIVTDLNNLVTHIKQNFDNGHQMTH